jgi:hypothetical protein
MKILATVCSAGGHKTTYASIKVISQKVSKIIIFSIYRYVYLYCTLKQVLIVNGLIKIGSNSGFGSVIFGSVTISHGSGTPVVFTKIIMRVSFML